MQGRPICQGSSLCSAMNKPAEILHHQAPRWLLPLQAKCIFCLTFPNCQRHGEQKPYIHSTSKCPKCLGFQNISACNKAQPLLLFMKPAGRRSWFITHDHLLYASSSLPFLKVWPKSISNWAHWRTWTWLPLTEVKNNSCTTNPQNFKSGLPRKEVF